MISLAHGVDAVSTISAFLISAWRLAMALYIQRIILPLVHHVSPPQVLSALKDGKK